MRGTKPLPTNLKLLRGETRPSQIPENEPKPTILVPDAPDYLTEDQQQIFTRTAQLLAGLRVMSAGDTDSLALYASTFSRWIELEKFCRDNGSTVSSPNGYEIPRPERKMADKALDQSHKLLAEFGLTPSSRTRISKM